MESIDGDGTYMYNPSNDDQMQTSPDSKNALGDDYSKKSMSTYSDKTTDSDSPNSSEAIEETQLGEPIDALKKKLVDEEEFRLIDHKEPIHIFLKIKPLSFQEQAKQKDNVNTFI